MTIFIIPPALVGASSLMSIFNRFGHNNESSMKRRADYSQNFLNSSQLVRELVAKSNLKKTDLVYDFGAGSGIISSVLAEKVAKVRAVEYDARLLPTLQKNLERFSNTTIEQGDILNIPFPNTPFKVFANIPFHISSAIVQRFINNPHAPVAAYLIVQRQFGRKLEANDTSHFTSQLGMVIGAEYAVKIIKNLRKTDFTPRPAVDTVCVELVKRQTPLVAPERLKAYEKFTTECFADPRKLAKLPLEVIGATPGLSPSRLSLAQWVMLFHAQTLYK